jgi:hypothetical protein
MKKIILSAFAVAVFQFAQAQQTQQPAETPATKAQKPTPEQMANRQATHLQKVLTLSEEQKQKVYQAALTRSTAMQQLKGQNNGNRKALHADAKPIKEQYVKDVNATLTPEQQQKWESYRLQQKQKEEARKSQLNQPANGTNNAAPATATPVKLEPHDDGMKDQ